VVVVLVDCTLTVLPVIQIAHESIDLLCTPTCVHTCCGSPSLSLPTVHLPAVEPATATRKMVMVRVS
jgi:hypothetical protein